LPLLRPPTDGLVALLNVPPTAQLHVPISLLLLIRNHHPSRSANITVQLEPDPSDGFVVAGLRSGRVPILVPGTEEKLTWRLIPLECGYVSIPRIKVVDRRKAIASAQGIGGPNAEIETEGEVVKIIDVRLDHKNHGDINETSGRNSMDSVTPKTKTGLATILVLP
jgi:hypothetical protein